MTFNFDSIYAPDAALDIKDWRFSEDLRNHFPKIDGNNEISKLLERRGVIVKCNEADPEYSCTYVYFKTEKQAKAFLKRLNRVPEIAGYVPPPPMPETFVAMSEENWKNLREFLKTALTPEKHAELIALDILLYEIPSSRL